MKTFRYSGGHKAGQTMTVGELIKKLEAYPEDMPVFAEWESVQTWVEPKNFEVMPVGKGHPDDICDCLVIDVNDY